MADQDRTNEQADGATAPSDGELSGDTLESAAGGVIGVDTDGDGIIDQGCTPNPIPIFTPTLPTFGT